MIHENLCSVKVWFKNTFTIIEKYESKVLKLNPEGIFGLIWFCCVTSFLREFFLFLHSCFEKFSTYITSKKIPIGFTFETLNLINLGEILGNSSFHWFNSMNLWLSLFFYLFRQTVLWKTSLTSTIKFLMTEKDSLKLL